MIAFVLSGAGNRGPIEAGALIALIEHGIQPDILVGTSAGAINSLYLAAHGATLNVAKQMPEMWRSFSTKDVYPNNILQIGWRLVTKKNSFYENSGMRRLIVEMLPTGVNTFADLQIPLYTTAVDIRTSRLFTFGVIDRDKTPLVNVVLASASVPAIHPPVNYHELQLVDGGVVANVAASVAMQQGATEIYVLNAGRKIDAEPVASGIPEIISYTWGTVLSQSLLRDIEDAVADDDVDLHHIHLDAHRGTWFRDFSKSDQMVQAGYDATKAYMTAPVARAVAPQNAPSPNISATPPPGAEEFTLPPNR